LVLVGCATYSMFMHRASCCGGALCILLCSLEVGGDTLHVLTRGGRTLIDDMACNPSDRHERLLR